jgi:hypothetical protein
MLAGIPAAISLVRHLAGTSRTNDLVSIVTLRFLATSCVVVGFVVTQRLPGNAIGWLLLAAGVGFTTYFAATELALAAILVDGNVETAWLAVIALSWPLVIGAISLMLLALMLFPDGKLLSRSWLAAIAVLAIGYVLAVFDYLTQDTLEAPCWSSSTIRINCMKRATPHERSSAARPQSSASPASPPRQQPWSCATGAAPLTCASSSS